MSQYVIYRESINEYIFKEKVWYFHRYLSVFISPSVFSLLSAPTLKIKNIRDAVFSVFTHGANRSLFCCLLCAPDHLPRDCISVKTTRGI